MQFNKAILILVFCCIAAVHIDAQGWRKSFSLAGGNAFYQDGNYVTGVYTYPNGVHIFAANFPDQYANYQLGNINPDGYGQYCDNSFDENGAFHHFSKDLLALTDSIWMVLENRMPFAGGNKSIYLSEYQYNYDIPCHSRLWHRPILTDAVNDLSAIGIQRLPSGDLITLGNIRTSVTPEIWNPVLVKTDTAANPIWSVTLTDANNAGAVQMALALDGGFYVLKNVKTGTAPVKTEAWLVKTDAQGQVEWQNNLSGTLSDTPGALAIGADSSLIVAGVSNDGTGLFLIKTDAAGNIVWRKDFSLPFQEMDICKVLEHDNGELAMVGTGDENIFVVRTTAEGAPIWERNYGRPNAPQKANDACITPDGGYLIGGRTFNQIIHAYLIKADQNGIIKPGLIHGNVFHDLNADCLLDTSDIPMDNWIVSAFLDEDHIFYGNTDSTGNYRIECDTGNYVVSITLPSPYWQACDNQIPLHIGYQDTALVNFPISPAVECPYMTVEHASLLVRPCDTVTYHVNYCNLGTVPAEGAYIEIQLDTIFTFVASDIPPSSINNNLITFPLGDVAPLECQQFSFYAGVSCMLDTGLVACSQAHIYPDSLCVPEGLWSGAVIAAEGVCDGDSIRFTIRNTGTAPSQMLEYIVIEDAVLLHQGSFQLMPGGTMEVAESATGATLHLLAQQEPGVPGNNQPTVAVEGCTGSSGNLPSTGFFNQFSQNDADPFLSEWCLVVVSSFDPNDKQAFPTGFGEEHNIFAHNDLEYMIRFQNTGTDTAFRVILLDTLSPLLDPASVKLGASSHPCRLDLEDTGVLRFTFQNIQLPHEAVNAPASNGFVTFRVKQKFQNPIGSKIENRAGIYFDFNLPVITNTVHHTIHAPLIEILSFTQPEPAAGQGVKAYPNPFRDQIQFELMDGTNTSGLGHLQVFNSLGVVIRDITFNGSTTTLSGEGMPAGIYLFQIRNDKGVLAHGKIQVK